MFHSTKEEKMSTVSSTAVRVSTTLPAALVAIAVSAALLAVGAWGDSNEANPTRRFVITLAVAVVCAVPVFGWAVPRARRFPEGNTAIVLAVLALLSLGVFWLGVTFILAVGAVTAGLGGSQAWSRSSWPQRAAVILGSAAGLAFIVVTLLQLA
jgi:uncharacterized membrane protein